LLNSSIGSSELKIIIKDEDGIKIYAITPCASF